jgi:hypothetical protein
MNQAGAGRTAARTATATATASPRRIATALLALASAGLLAHCGDGGGASGAGPGADAGATADAARDDASTGSDGAVASACAANVAPADVNGFTRYTVDAAATGASFVATGDVDGDGRTDLVVSKFGAIDSNGAIVKLAPGEVSVFYQGATLGCWREERIVGAADAIYFPNQPTTADVDGDGDLDVIVPGGFFVCGFDKAVNDCGTLAWFENRRGSGTPAWVRHDIAPRGDAEFYHGVELVDFDGDGVKDLVTTGETMKQARARWYKGDASPGRFDVTPRVIGDGMGSFTRVADIDHDGDLDVASAEFFVTGESAGWYERTGAPSAAAPAGTWARHVVNADSGRCIMMHLIPDLYGDGAMRAVATNHTNANPAADNPDPVASAVFAFEVPADPTKAWTKTTLASGIMARASAGAGASYAPGVFGYGDVDGDGDIDLAVSGDGDARTFWLEQTTKGSFTMHVIEDALGQASGGLVVDLNGDGKNEIVFTGYENNVVYVYARKP